MANFTNMLMNPWVLHLQKLGLELKCPLCLKLLNQPVLLPCDHVFCDSCIHESSQVESGCPVCKSKHPKKARRNLHFMESVISIYKSLNAAVGVHLPQLQIRNGSNRPQDGGSEDSEMIDKDVIKGNGGGSDSSSLDVMANFTNMLMNPWVLHLQKLGLELKCPLCLKLLNQPVLLPCDHVFCESCIHESSQVESGCPVCKSKHPKKARRNLHFMESVISIYESLNAAVGVHLPQLQIRNGSNGPRDGGSEDSEMIDKDVIKGNGGGSDSSSLGGTVGGYWGNHSKGVDSGGSVSSFKGIPNTTSKYREDKSVNWHSTPFEARLEKALKRDK
ncbi:hypothetical protein F2Q69_00063850 [Brassica cretica]|uniref:RING-type domain-containing protein n=1 Tax=Brassica cretica TaxID=69181 RepID=A0A8S9RDP8_BRACR|nr:hypothetical protein F2Q69_00063850 [Brassica cretica]